MNRKEKYRIFAEKEKLPIFMQPYWLDSVCEEGMEWDVILYEKGGEIWGSFVYVVKKKYGFTLITMPKLTQFLGPYIKYPEGQKYYRRLSWEKEVMNYFIDNLPKFDYFNMNFHYSITNWLPFYWRGFKQTTRYTYVIEDLSNLEKVWNNLDRVARKNIKKALNSGIKVINSKNIDDLYRINKITFELQGIKPPYSKKLLRKIFSSLIKRNKVLIKFAIKYNQIISVMMGVYDEKSIYMLVGSSDKRNNTFGAEYLLYWEMIKFASNKNLIFDFEGSMMENIEIRNRSFGAIQKPYFNISKINSKLLKLRDCLRRLLK